MANESELRLHRCCFTGHRPEKLHMPESTVISGLEREIRKAIDDGFTVFISGMARGVDIWAAEIVLRLRGEGKPIRLIAAVPHDGFETRWSLDWQKRYAAILAAADLVKILASETASDFHSLERRSRVLRNSHFRSSDSGLVVHETQSTAYEISGLLHSWACFRARARQIRVLPQRLLLRRNLGFPFRSDFFKIRPQREKPVRPRHSAQSERSSAAGSSDTAGFDFRDIFNFPRPLVLLPQTQKKGR